MPETTTKKSLRVIPLGGLEEVGNNMMLIEYDQDILIIDMGFMFPSEEMLGVDYAIPDIRYLEKNQNKIRGIIITHGHLDHTGGIPYILPKIGYPPVFGTKLTCGLIKERLEEFKMHKKISLNIFDPKDSLKLGVFIIEFFRVNHNIPDGVGVGILTPEGLVVHTGDFKFDYTPQDQKPTDFTKIAEFSSKGVLVACSDSTNAEEPGYAIPEKKIEEVIDDIFDDAKGRIIVATFSSLLSRIQQIINASINHDRKITISGLSMQKSIEVGTRLGYLKFPKEYFVPLNRIKNYKDNQITIIATGSQGNEYAALSRMSRGEHREIKIKKGDTVILSSSPIPGNERAIHAVMDNLYRQGARVLYKKIMDVHTGGHGRQEDLKLMLSLLQPKYFIPIHGEHHMLVAHANLAESIGIPQENTFIMDNGQILEIKSGQAKIASEKIPAGFTLIDGLGVGDVGNIVLRDRQVLAKDGMVVIICEIDSDQAKLIKEPNVISRGFVYMKKSGRLIHQIKREVEKLFSGRGKEYSTDFPDMKASIRDRVGAFIFKKTERRPMILPVIIEV